MFSCYNFKIAHYNKDDFKPYVNNKEIFRIHKHKNHKEEIKIHFLRKSGNHDGRL